MKKIITTIALIFIGICIIVVIVNIRASSSGNFTNSNSITSNPVVTQPKEIIQKPNLELIDGINGTHDEIIDHIHYIVGSIKNNTSHKYSYAQISFIILDKDMNQIGTAWDNINDLESGVTWKFKAMVFDDTNFKHYKVGDISGW